MTTRIVGTAGHVDHGKTTLVKALTGIDTDRLPEEKKRGISIELGFAPLDLGDGLRASIIDVPGHRKLVRAMIAGAMGIELVMLVVAADEGVMPQTREHVAVCELLGIRRALVVVTKIDAVDADLAGVAEEEVRGLLGGWSVDVVRCSAKTGEGVERVRTALREALLTLASRPRGRSARLGVDRVFTVRGAGTVVTGTLVDGELGVGDAVSLVGHRAARASVARGLHVHDVGVARAQAPTRLAVNLGGLALEDVRRGDVVTTDPALRATTLFDVLVRKPHSLARGAAVTAYAGTASSLARIDAVTDLEGGAVARVRLAHRMVVAGADRVVFRGGKEGPAGAVVGGGVVVDALPDRRGSGAKRRTLAAALATLDATATARALVEASAPRALSREALARRFAVDGAEIAAAADRLVKEGSLASVGTQGWMARDRFDGLVARARELVKRHEKDAPLERGLPLATLRARLAAAGPVVAEEVIRVATSTGRPGERLAIEGDVVRSAERSNASPAGEASDRLRAADQALREAGVAGATETTIAEKTGATPADVRAVLQRLARDGAALRLGELWFATGIVEEARARMMSHFAAAPTLSVVEFKQIAGFARKQAVLLLEHFDRLGLTKRVGDARVLR
jgi:selenocysteine-specific elongation factor